MVFNSEIGVFQQLLRIVINNLLLLWCISNLTMDYPETLKYLYASLPAFHRTGAPAYKAGLDNTLAIDRLLGQPHRKFKTIHVAGTNGKGSVSHMLAAVLQQAGYRTGLYTSPHLRDFRERIRIDGRMISKGEVVDFVATHHEEMEKIGPSFFEWTVGLAFDHFARHDVDVAVIEVGMGGRLDSTNIITPLVSVITNISLDHTQFLGATRAAIAAEKAGIIKSGVPVVVGETDPETAPVFIGKSREAQSRLLFADQCYRTLSAAPTLEGQRLAVESRMDDYAFEIDLDLAGRYQRKNILTVIATLDVLQESGAVCFTRGQAEAGLRHAAATTGLMGRWQVLGRDPLVICDTGHNAAGLEEVAAQLQNYDYERLFIVFGAVNDKDLDAIFPHLPREAHYLFTQAAIDRALPAETLAAQARQAGLKGEAIPSVKEALAQALAQATPKDLIFIGGSTFIVAEIV